MKLHSIIIAAAAALVAVACGSNSKEPLKDLVVYYSQTGSTKALSQVFAEKTGADIIELQLVTPYPDDYNATLEASRAECANMTGRALIDGTLDLSKYGRIFIGYPVWYGTITPPIVSLAKDNNLFKGKEVVLFCTFGSGGTRTSSNAFKELCPEAKVIDTFGMTGKRVALRAEQEVEAFLATLGQKKDQTPLLGGYSERRELTEEDMQVFQQAMEGYDYLGLVAKGVCSQVVAGTNYVFFCTNGPEGTAELQVKVFNPLPGQGNTELVEVLR